MLSLGLKPFVAGMPTASFPFAEHTTEVLLTVKIFIEIFIFPNVDAFLDPLVFGAMKWAVLVMSVL